jgi:AcrR family transcriptional regulator
MGRRADLTPGETRRQLLDAAMRLMVERGFEGVRVAEVAKEAGVSTGAIYSQFASKGELLAAAIADQAPPVIAEHIASGGDGPVLELFRAIGLDLPDRAGRVGRLLLEVIVSATRDPGIGALVSGQFSQNEAVARAAIRLAQESGEIDPALDAGALGRFVSMMALGSLAPAALGMQPVDPAAWEGVISRVVDAVRPPRTSG